MLNYKWKLINKVQPSVLPFDSFIPLPSVLFFLFFSLTVFISLIILFSPKRNFSSNQTVAFMRTRRYQVVTTISKGDFQVWI
jgi:hypothetical protein